MNILLDECVPRPLRRSLIGHAVRTVPEMGWASVKNGELIRFAETQFDVMITVDKSIKYQQKLDSTKIGFIVLKALSNRLEDLEPLVPDILISLNTIQAGDVVTITA